MTNPASSTHSVLGLGTQGLVYGCDYNPEQWDAATWAEDVTLMVTAGVNLVAINIFGWSHVEPQDGVYAFTDLDTIIELLHSNGIGVNLGTGTSSPPPWLTTKHPEILPMVADGTTRWPGGRQAWCPSSPVFRAQALKLVEQTALRYGDHPAVKLWHVSNEIGCHNALCYCSVSASAFRVWLQSRYGTVDALNTAWGTAFWSQHYSTWDEISPPRATLSVGNPTQSIDFSRFSSDELLSYYKAEAAVLRDNSSKPVTTNFMVTAHIRTQNYWQWAPQMDVIANDHYLDNRLAVPHRELSFSADATRGLAQGRPWLLMEHSTSAVNWQPLNRAKIPGELMRNSLTHVARGADGVCFFQWRASAQGSEKYHSAIVPHGGTNTRIWRESVELGALMHRLGELAGSTVQASIAIVFSWESWWAADLEAHPSSELKYIEQIHALYESLWGLNLTVDVVAPGAALDGYNLVVVPSLYLVSDADALVITDFVRAGGHAVVTFFSGIVDEDDRVRPGMYPGAFREMLGVASEEFYPIGINETVVLSDGSTGSQWSELLHLTGAEVALTYAEGPLAGIPAVTRNSYGDGAAWYLATTLEPQTLTKTLATIAGDSGLQVNYGNQNGVEIVRRATPSSDYIFVLNHTDHTVHHGFEGYELVNQQVVEGETTVLAGGVHIIRQKRTHS